LLLLLLFSNGLNAPDSTLDHDFNTGATTLQSSLESRGVGL